MPTVVVVRLPREGDADNATHIPKTRGRMDEESGWQNPQKIPPAFLGTALCKLVSIAHLTKFIFFVFLPQHIPHFTFPWVCFFLFGI